MIWHRWHLGLQHAAKPFEFARYAVRCCAKKRSEHRINCTIPFVRFMTICPRMLYLAWFYQVAPV